MRNPAIEFVYTTNKNQVSLTLFPLLGVHNNDDLNDAIYSVFREAYYGAYGLRVNFTWC